MSWLNRRMHPLDGADRVWLVRPLQSEIGVLIAAIKIKGSRPQRIADAARQSVNVVRIDPHWANHVCGGDQCGHSAFLR